MMVEELQKAEFFEYLLQIFVSTLLLGFIYKRKAEVDPGDKK